MSEPDVISIRGASEHNLKDVSLEIPKKTLVVFTGVSGCGKSSLAFDTLYAEGQRRYVESLSAYARQFLGQMEKPKYETLRGLSPTISIEQKAASNNPRSTVGTVTEVHDYLRVLYASIGVQHCSKCGRRVGQQIGPADRRGDPPRCRRGRSSMLLAPLVQERKGEHKDLLADAQKRGFARARDRRPGPQASRSPSTLDKKAKHDIELVVDRLVLKPELRSRLTDSVETALREGKGVLIVTDESGGNATGDERAERLPPLRPVLRRADAGALLASTTRWGCARTATASARKPEMDPDLIVPDPARTIREGAVEPWASGMVRGRGLDRGVRRAAGEGVRHRPGRARGRSSASASGTSCSTGPEGKEFTIKWGAGGRWTMEWEGMVHKLMRCFKTTQSRGDAEVLRAVLLAEALPDLSRASA